MSSSSPASPIRSQTKAPARKIHQQKRERESGARSVGGSLPADFSSPAKKIPHFEISLPRPASASHGPKKYPFGSEWKPIPLGLRELRLEITLNCGQVFRWSRTRVSGEAEYVGVLRKSVIEMRQGPDQVFYRVLFSLLDSGDRIHGEVLDFFNAHPGTGIKLEDLYAHFSTRDPVLFEKIAPHCPGVRILRQDPLECLLSFLCTSNNNIARITLMIEKLCEKYGTRIGEHEGASYFAFPTVRQLEGATEPELREIGFGYRAAYLVKTLKQLGDKAGEQRIASGEAAGGLDQDALLRLYFDKLRTLDVDRTLQELMEFAGIGLKCAACISLYSCDKHDVVPIGNKNKQTNKHKANLGLRNTAGFSTNQLF